MSYPLYFDFGPVHLSAHRLFELLAFFLGYRLYVWQRARSADLISTEHRWWIFTGAAAGAWLGSHVLGILENPAQLAHLHWTRLLIDKTIVGGLLGGLFGVECTKKYLDIRHSSGDLMTYPLLFGLVIGRIGCHLAGLDDGTHGNPTALPWGIDFGDGIPRHPVSLYEIAFLAALAAGIFFIKKKYTLPDGARFKLFLISYLCWRFLIEFWKPVWTFSFGLSVIQLATLAGLWYYRKDIRSFLFRRK